MKDTSKKPKAKGPIRFEAVIPFAVVVALIGIYMTLFFDGHLRSGVEWALSKANGAQVDIANVKTSFVGGSFTLSGLGITDDEKPSHNSLELGRIHFQFSWDALLRAKFVVVDASIDGIQVGVPRKTPGWVKKDDPAESKSGEGQEGGATKSSALADAAKMLEGADPLKDLKDIGELKSQAKIKELKTQLEGKDKEWKAVLDSLPKGQELESLKTRIGAIKIGGTNNPAEIQKQIQDADSVVREALEKINAVKSKGEGLSKDIENFNKSFKELEASIREDRANLESKLKLPSLDAETLAAQIFGPSFQSKVNKAKHYWGLAQKYKPKKEAKEPQVEAPARMAGRNFHFAKTKGYPLFWLQRAAISSKAENSPFGGDLKGELLDVCSHPAQIGKPAVLQVAGNFPGQNMSDVALKLAVDLTQETPKADIQGRVGKFDVAGRSLTEGESLKLGFAKASGRSELKGVVVGEKIDLKSESVFKEIGYQVESNSADLKKVVEGALADVPTVDVMASAKGTFTDLKIDIRSSLGEALQRGFEKQLKAKLDEAKQKLDELINSKIGKEKGELEAKLNQIKGQIDSQLKEKSSEVNKVKGQADQKVNEAKNSATKQIVPKGLDDLKKKLGF